jgi:predicted transcriptional regulator
MARPKKYDQERVTTAIRMSEELQNRLKEAADERDISVNLLAVKAIADYLDHLIPTDEILQTRRSA